MTAPNMKNTCCRVLANSAKAGPKFDSQGRLKCRLGKTPEGPARRHRTDEDALVEEVLGQPDPVTEQGTLGERTRRVDREHCDLAVLLPELLGQGTDQGALANPGRAGETRRCGRG